MATFLLPLYNLVQVFCIIKPRGNGPSPAHRAWLITFNLTPVNAVLVCACMILYEKVSIVLLPLVVTISLYSVQSSTLVMTLLSSNMVVVHRTAKRYATLALTKGITSVSISISFITFMMQPLMGVPRIMGTQAMKLDKSRAMRAI